jgi:hypothetical protein
VGASWVSAAVVLAICISENRPSCMRAPPVAVMQTKGRRCSTAAHAAHEALADHRAHRAAHELELEGGDDHRQGLHRALHHHQRVGPPRSRPRRRSGARVALAVLELERVDRQHLGADLEAALGIEQQVEPGARAQAMVVAALRADAEFFSRSER